jgi:hypothetical protein
MASRFNLPDVQESLAGAIRQLDKAKPLFGIEPLHPGLGLTAR